MTEARNVTVAKIPRGMVADIVDGPSLERVRAHKKLVKQANQAKKVNGEAAT